MDTATRVQILEEAICFIHCTNTIGKGMNPMIFLQVMDTNLSKSSPFRGVLTCLFIEFLDSGPFRFMIPKDSSHFYYIDEILLIYTRNYYLTKFTDRLNNIEPPLDFTYESENNKILSLLDILLINNNNKLEFKIHHKSSNKNDLTNFWFGFMACQPLLVI